MSPETAIQLINSQTNAGYTLGDQLAGGENQGAYLVKDAAGQSAVLKVSHNPMWLSQIKRAQAATDHLRPLGYPTPEYSTMGSSGEGSYWLQSLMPGAHAIDHPSLEQTTDLLRLIELQKGQVISEVQGQDWVWYLTDVVFRGESGNVRALMQFSPEASALASAVETLVVGLQGKALPKSDLVHGDLNAGQVLFSGETVSGVIDWDQVGYGDRTIDLVGLWYSLLQSPHQRELVMARILEISDIQAIKIYVAARILALVAWSINTPGNDPVAAMSQAHLALDLIGSLGATPAAPVAAPPAAS